MFIKLETLKENEWLLEVFSYNSTRYLKQDCGGGEGYWARPQNQGYTPHFNEAGVWHLKAIYEAMKTCGPEKKIVFKIEGLSFEDIRDLLCKETNLLNRIKSYASPNDI